ncbi:MAG: hypothetical protein ACREVI_15020 [Steroidobacteraceae bacterium]
MLAACGGDSDRSTKTRAADKKTAAVATVEGIPAERTRRLDLAACFEENLDEAATTSRCPSFAILQLDYMGSECNAVGGKLQPVAEPVAWTLDVDGDASGEVLVDLAANLDCQGAPGVFSCGSGGCPFFLYAKRDDAWVELGAINADDAPAIEVLPQTGRTPATLRGGCTGMRPCSELTHYEWQGKAYARSWIDYRGNPVDVAAGGLRRLARDAPILDAPAKVAQVLDEYPVGTAVIVIGNARGAPYQFVSPCNACRRGFVETAALAQ